MTILTIVTIFDNFFGNFDNFYIFWAILTILTNFGKFWHFFQYLWQFLGDFRTILGFGSECRKVSYEYNAIVAGREMFPYWYFWVLSAWGLSMIIVAYLHFIYHRMLLYTSPWSDPISFNHFDVLLLKYHSGKNWPSFTRGDSVGNKMKAKFMTQINVNCNMFHITFGLGWVWPQIKGPDHRICRNLSKFLKIVKNCQHCKKLSKLPKKIVTIGKNCWNSQNCQMLSTNFKIVKNFWVNFPN